MSAPNPPANPPTKAVTRIKDKLFGSESIAATRSVRRESVLISVMVAIKNQSMPMPTKPAIKEDSPLVEMIKLIKKLAITTDHQGDIVWSKNASTAVNPIFNNTLKQYSV